MKRVTAIITVCIAMISFFAISISEGFDEAIVIPIDFIDRIQLFNNDNGEWEKAGFLICSSYFEDIPNNSYEYTDYSLSASNIRFGKMIGNLSVSIYSAKHMNLPSDMGDSFTITAKVFDPKATRYEESSIYKDTLAYYESVFGNSIAEENHGCILDKSRGIQINVSCDESYSMIEITVHVSMIPDQFVNEL